MDPPRPAGAGAGAGAGEEEGEEEAVGPRWWGHFNEWWAPVRAENEVRKTAFKSRFTSKRSICQDRLGTNIEKKLTAKAFFLQAAEVAARLTRSEHNWYAKKRSFSRRLHSNDDHFTKTGWGQTTP